MRLSYLALSRLGKSKSASKQRKQVQKDSSLRELAETDEDLAALKVS
jgi:hypothetical protein